VCVCVCVCVCTIYDIHDSYTYMYTQISPFEETILTN